LIEIDAQRGKERGAISVNRSALLILITCVLILPDDDSARHRRAAQAAVTTAQLRLKPETLLM